MLFGNLLIESRNPSIIKRFIKMFFFCKTLLKVFYLNHTTVQEGKVCKLKPFFIYENILINLLVMERFLLLIKKLPKSIFIVIVILFYIY